MNAPAESESRKLLQRLRQTLSQESAGQARLDQIVQLTAESMATHVCSIYLFSDDETLELCATQGLRQEAVHQTRMKLGEGLVGRVARTGRIVNSPDAPKTAGFRYMPETGEEVFSSFLGVPIQRLGNAMGVLVVQSRDSRKYTKDEIYALEVVAMVLAEMTELGAFIDGAQSLGSHRRQALFRGVVGQEGISEGQVWLHEPRVVVTNPFSDDPILEQQRLEEAVNQLRVSVDQLLSSIGEKNSDSLEVLETYRMFANSKGWMRRMHANIASGLSAEAAVEKEQSAARSRMVQVADAYLRDRLHDIDDLSNRLLRILTGQGGEGGALMPPNPILVASNIGPAELLEYGRKIKGIVLEEGSVGSHATVVARAFTIPLVINATGITSNALNGDAIIVDGDSGSVHLRPDDAVATAFHDKISMQAATQNKYQGIRDLPAVTKCGTQIELCMNAGLMADLPSFEPSGAEGVGLFRTELQFLVRNRMPKRDELATLYGGVMDAARGKKVVFRTLDIGSDKVLPYMTSPQEPNPAMGWRAIRVGLDRRGVLRMQIQALIRAAKGRPLYILFPLIAQMSEFDEARDEVDRMLLQEQKLGHKLPSKLEVGATLETPSLAFAPDAFFQKVDFISIGGNDLKQFFFAADRENELVRRRYDAMNVSYMTFLEHIVQRCRKFDTPLSFCGEDAGRPLFAACLGALGVDGLSMRAASIGPVKNLLRQIDLREVKSIIDQTRESGSSSVRSAVSERFGGLLGG